MIYDRLDKADKVERKKNLYPYTYVGLDSRGYRVVDIGGDALIRYREDGTHPDWSDLENIPQKVERWVVGKPSDYCYVYWFISEKEAMEFWEKNKGSICKPVRIEVELP